MKEKRGRDFRRRLQESVSAEPRTETDQSLGQHASTADPVAIVDADFPFPNKTSAEQDSSKLARKEPGLGVTEWLPTPDENDDDDIEKAEAPMDPVPDPDADFPGPEPTPSDFFSREGWARSRLRDGRQLRDGGARSGGVRVSRTRDGGLRDGRFSGQDTAGPFAPRIPDLVNSLPEVDPDAELLTFNGIDAATGKHWTPPMTEDVLARALWNRKRNLEEERYLRAVVDEKKDKELYRELRPGDDPKDLSQTGWGVVLAEDADPRLLIALEPLLELRKSQAKDLFRIFSGPGDRTSRKGCGYRKGTSALIFLADQGAGTGPVEPDIVPYYLLLVGGPKDIPNAVQSQLGVRYAVGRIHFDNLNDYRRYAESVRQAEKKTPADAPSTEVVLFGAGHENDSATLRAQDELIEPLYRSLKGRGRKVQRFIGPEARVDRLRSVLGGTGTPQVLFTSSHGMVYSSGSWSKEEQQRLQGGLLCSDWLGETDELHREDCFTADDLADDASLQGSICFHFACYSAGTPRFDNFAFLPKDQPERQDNAHPALGAQIADEPFIAALPKRMLSLPEGRGALAVIGHVDRTWTTAFSYLGRSSEVVVFTSVLEELLHAFPIGHAMRFMTQRYAALASDVALLEDPSAPAEIRGSVTWARMWRAQSDARNFVVIGDPAVRLVTARETPVPSWRG